MKRSIIIKKLVSEGLSEKTLSTMTDKQIDNLSIRILGESTVYISKSNPNLNQEVEKAKLAKKTVETYESEMKEQKETKESARTFANQNRPNQHQSKKFKSGSPFKNNFSPVETSKTTKKFKKEERLKVKGKSKPFEKSPKAKLAKSLKNLKENQEVMKWIDEMVQEKYHPLATKNEIMEVVRKKIVEGAAEPDVAEPITRPTTRPGNPEREKRRENFPNPWDPPKENPVTDPDPKFETEDLPDWLESDELLSIMKESKIDKITSIIMDKINEQAFNDAADRRNNSMERGIYEEE